MFVLPLIAGAFYVITTFATSHCEAHWGYGATNKYAPKTCEKEDVQLINARIAIYKRQIEALKSNGLVR